MLPVAQVRRPESQVLPQALPDPAAAVCAVGMCELLSQRDNHMCLMLGLGPIRCPRRGAPGFPSRQARAFFLALWQPLQGRGQHLAG